MKKYLTIALILVVAVLAHSASTDYRIGTVDPDVTEKYMLPGWIDMNGAGNSIVPYRSSYVISLGDGFHVNYRGKEYSSLSIYYDGSIVLGESTKELSVVTNPRIKPLNGWPVSGVPMKWKSVVEEIPAPQPGGAKLIENYTVVMIGPFDVREDTASKLQETNSYSVQIVLYTDGEFQVQFWRHTPRNENVLMNEWKESSVFNGTTWQRITEAPPSEMAIFKDGKLREGWIAKGFDKTDSKIASLTINQANQLVFDMGTDTYAGALVAYDYSREHPVVGGIEGVNFSFSHTPIFVPRLSTIYYWYFDEVPEDYTIHSKYPELVFSDQGFVCNWYSADGSTTRFPVSRLGTGAVYAQLKSSFYNYSWWQMNGFSEGNTVWFNTDPVVFRPAPAFKFQKSFDDPITIAYNSISYKLLQLPGVRILPPKTAYTLTTSSTGEGRILVKTPLGTSPYSLFKKELVRAEIRSSVGYKIKEVTLNNVTIFKDGAFVLKSELGKNAAFASWIKSSGYKPDEMLVFETVAEMNMDLHVDFEPCGGRILDPVIPEMVIKRNFLDPEKTILGRRNASAIVKGSFGENVEKLDSLIAQDDMGNTIPYKYIVSAYYTDDFGAKDVIPGSFVHDTSGFEYVDMACKACIHKANDYYNGDDAFDRPNALGVAYVKYDRRYGSGDGSNGTSYGIADASFEDYPEQAESWTLPAANDHDFIPKDDLTPNSIALYYGSRMNSTSSYIKHSLTVVRDAEGRFSQTISNSKGQTVATWRILGDKEYVVKYDYDEYDRLKTITPDNNSKLAITYTYDKKGRVATIKDPERGLSRSVYDKFGRLRFVQNQEQQARGRFTAKIYDDHGREVAVVEVTGGHSIGNPDGDIDPKNYIPYNRTHYGMPDAQTLKNYGLNVDAALISSILSNMKNIRDKNVGATFAYDADGNLAVAKMASYDRIGRKTRQWIIYMHPGVPAVQLSYDYNSADELYHSTFAEWNGSIFKSRAQRYRSYDAAGRLLKIQDENRRDLASYEYTRDGNVKSKSYYDKGTLVYKKTILRDVHGRPTEIRYENNSGLLYSDNIEYETPLAGRVSNAEHVWKNLQNIGDETRSSQYTYDLDGRLTKAEGTLSGEYAYKGFAGQMTSKQEGSGLVEMAYSNDHYRPSGFSVNGESAAKDVKYFEYDGAGNVWYDRNARTAFRLNAAGLPEEAYVIRSGYAEPTLQEVRTGNVGGVALTLRMAYDEGGNRIWTVASGTAMSFDRAIIPGVGVYTASSGSSSFTLERMDLVAGGFLDEAGVAHYPVTDAQGNIRGYASTAGLDGAYDYYPYGSAVEVQHASADNGKRWQGKDEDWPIRKLYFGARYYDPFFAMWMSPDPAGQFANPYSYGGDPVNYVDPNGEWVHIVVGAIVGAVVGTVNAGIQCYAGGMDVSQCGKNVYVQQQVGAAAGAAAAATGGAVGGGLIGRVLGGAAGGAVGYGANYAGQKVIMQNDVEWDGNALFKATWQGALTGSVGAAAGSVANGATGAMLGGLASGAVGSWASGDEGWWDILQGGLLGAGMGLISYAASIGAEYNHDKKEVKDIRKRLDNELAFELEGLDDLYQKQSLYDQSTSGGYTGHTPNDQLEYGLVSGSKSAIMLEYDGYNHNHFPSNAEVIDHGSVIHAHGELQPIRGPSPGDFDVMNSLQFRNHDVTTYQMDVVNKVINKYDYTGITETYQYRPRNDYKSFGQRFQW